MPRYAIEPIDLSAIDAVYPATMSSLFWEQGARRAHITGTPPDPHRVDHPHVPNLRDAQSNSSPEGHLTGFEESCGTLSHRSFDDRSDSLTAPHSDTRKDDAHQPGSHQADDREGDAQSSAHSSPFNTPGSYTREELEQIRFEKEAWLNAVFLSWGPCGYSLRLYDEARDSNVADQSGDVDNLRTVGTLLFSPPRFCPTTFSFPSGPISPDAIALTSYFYDPFEVDDDMTRALILTTLRNLALRGVSAVEVYGCSGSGDQDAEAGMPEPSDGSTEQLFAEIEQSLGDSKSLRPCHSAALGAINHEFGEMIRTKTLINAGFRVVTPHPVHPKLRIELDAELDWDEAVGQALNRSTTERFMRAKLFSI
nr:hypothetical protein [Corynebacterium lactis]